MEHFTDLLDASLDLEAIFHQVDPKNLRLLGGDLDADLDVPADQHNPTNEFLPKKRKIVLTGTCDVCGALANVQHRYVTHPGDFVP